MMKLQPPLYAYIRTEYEYKKNGTEDKVTFITDAKVANEYLNLADKASVRVQIFQSVFLIVCLLLVEFHDAIYLSTDNVALKIALFLVTGIALGLLYYFISKYTRSQAVCSRMADIYAGQGPSKLNSPYDW